MGFKIGKNQGRDPNGPIIGVQNIGGSVAFPDHSSDCGWCFYLSAIIAEFTVVVLDGSKTGPRLTCFHTAIPILRCTRNKCRYHARLNKVVQLRTAYGNIFGRIFPV